MNRRSLIISLGWFTTSFPCRLILTFAISVRASSHYGNSDDDDDEKSTKNDTEAHFSSSTFPLIQQISILLCCRCSFPLFIQTTTPHCSHAVYFNGEMWCWRWWWCPLCLNVLLLYFFYTPHFILSHHHPASNLPSSVRFILSYP